MSNEYGKDRQEDIWARCGWEGDTLLLPRSAIKLETKVPSAKISQSFLLVLLKVRFCESAIGAFDKDKVLLGAFP